MDILNFKLKKKELKIEAPPRGVNSKPRIGEFNVYSGILGLAFVGFSWKYICDVMVVAEEKRTSMHGRFLYGLMLKLSAFLPFIYARLTDIFGHSNAESGKCKPGCSSPFNSGGLCWVRVGSHLFNQFFTFIIFLFFEKDYSLKLNLS